ncbi:MAG: lipase [Bacteroidaceae bacterium]|nr:lipase [Bacteroidaceae bacterium]
MRHSILFLLGAFCFASVTAQNLVPNGKIISPTDKNIQYVGRVSMKNPNAPVWTYPGVQIRTGFTGTSLKMIAKPNSGYFMAQIDGSEAFKVCFNSKRDSIVTLAVALPEGTHQAKLMYISEGYDRRPEFHGFIVDKGHTLAPAPVLPERCIEFIGNSITCGYGVESTNPKDPYFEETANHYYTYAARAAEALDAQAMVVARSGIGVYRNYNGPRTGDKINMNTEYTHTLLYDDKETWDFNRFTPQVVCINLGTNDTSTSGADEKLLTNGYKKLLGQVREHYPNAKIVFLCGSMMNGKDLALAQKCMDKAVKYAQENGDSEVYRFDFTPQDGSLKYGASYHPSFWQHEKMAGELVAYLRVLMGWM